MGGTHDIHRMGCSSMHRPDMPSRAEAAQQSGLGFDWLECFVCQIIKEQGTLVKRDLPIDPVRRDALQTRGDQQIATLDDTVDAMCQAVVGWRSAHGERGGGLHQYGHFLAREAGGIPGKG